MRKFSALAAGLMMAVSTAALADDFPVTVGDDRDKEVTFTQQPAKVVTLANFGTDVMVALDMVPIGLTTYEGKRPLYLGDSIADAVDLGDLTAPNLELMASMDVDLTIGMLRYNGPFEEEITAISQFLAYNSADIEQSYYLVSSLGKALGHANKAEALNQQFKNQFADMQARVPEEKPTYLFLWNYFDAMYAYQDNLMPAQLYSDLGAKNLAGFNDDTEAAENAFVLLEPEQLLEFDPDVLFIFASHGGPIKHSPVFDRLSAVKNGRAYSMGYQYSQSSGPIARDIVLREGAHLLFPKTFDAPDMPDASRATPLQFVK